MNDFALIIGESLIDLVKHVNSDGEPTGHPGGSPMNVALTLSRLGRSTELLTWLARDAYGQRILDHLKDSGVSVNDLSWGAERTATALAIVADTGSATYQFDIDWSIPPINTVPQEAIFVHAGSLGAALAPGATTVLDFVERASASALISFDPNARPSIMGSADASRPLLERFIATSDVVKASDEDIAWLYPDTAVEEVVSRWFELGNLGLLVLTQGKAGPVAWTRGGVRIGKVPDEVTVVDTVGAGDSFMGSLINSLWSRGLSGRKGAAALGDLTAETVEAIIDEANAVANVTVSRAGANPPWAHELG